MVSMFYFIFLPFFQGNKMSSVVLYTSNYEYLCFILNLKEKNFHYFVIECNSYLRFSVHTIYPLLIVFPGY